MKVIIFGATGMCGQGVLRECLLDPGIESILSLVRAATGQENPKLRELVHHDFNDFSTIERELTGYEACFFTLGVTSSGMEEEQYRRITYDITLAAAGTLARLNPSMTFLYISGAGTDSTERGRSMWARVKGKTENDILSLPFKAAYMFRPGLILPLHGIKSKTRVYRITYNVGGPIFSLAHYVFPKHITTTEKLGRAMIYAARYGAQHPVLNAPDIYELARLSAVPSTSS